MRGEGGQIVVSPSIHPVTGKRYEWEDTFASHGMRTIGAFRTGLVG